jgi:hypothetical protein
VSGRAWIERFKLMAPLSAVLASCATQPPISARESADANDTGGSVPVTSAVERAVLRDLTRLPSGTPRRVIDATVVAEAPYTAASDRICRQLHLTLGPSGRKTERLACSRGTGWFFVPEIFGDRLGAE